MADNFQKTTEEVDTETFVEFINKICIWDYFGMSREANVALSSIEKRDKINKYYFDMKARVNSGKLNFFLFCWHGS